VTGEAASLDLLKGLAAIGQGTKNIPKNTEPEATDYLE
jgi:hypothetical protein